MIFDPAKEEFHVLARPSATIEKSTFKMLDVKIDNKLLMHDGVRHLCLQAAWRIKALRRVRRFYSIKQMVQLYKSRVLSFIEAGSVAFLHAAPSTLQPLDRLQMRYLEFLGISAEHAFFGVQFGAS